MKTIEPRSKPNFLLEISGKPPCQSTRGLWPCKKEGCDEFLAPCALIWEIKQQLMHSTDGANVVINCFPRLRHREIVLLFQEKKKVAQRSAHPRAAHLGQKSSPVRRKTLECMKHGPPRQLSGVLRRRNCGYAWVAWALSCVRVADRHGPELVVRRALEVADWYQTTSSEQCYCRP